MQPHQVPYPPGHMLAKVAKGDTELGEVAFFVTTIGNETFFHLYCTFSQNLSSSHQLHHVIPQAADFSRDGAGDTSTRKIILQALTAQGVATIGRSEEHTSELQSPCNLVCRLLLEKKKQHTNSAHSSFTAPPEATVYATLYHLFSCFCMYSFRLCPSPHRHTGPISHV